MIGHYESYIFQALFNIRFDGDANDKSNRRICNGN
jgi:hypothetical protein